MFIGRAQELTQLDTLYKSKHNAAVVLYGRKGIGKTALAKTFIEGKPSVYYSVREVTELEQKYIMREELMGLSEEEEVWTEVPDFLQTLYAAIMREGLSGEKVVVVLDEFQFLVKNSDDFVRTLLNLLNDANLSCFIILTSSSIRFIENDMVSELQIAVKAFSGIIKLHEFSFMELVNRFPKMPIEDIIYVYGVLGGVPGYLEYWDETKTVRGNIEKLFFDPKGAMFNEANDLLKEELRELPVYNAVLTSIAQGRYKLNDIYARTEFSRAKISVYIKNLIEIGVAEKIFSFDNAEHENAQKGIYKISDKLLCFWYRYVFPNMSKIHSRTSETVYDECVLPTIDEYMRECYKDVCAEYLKIMNAYKKLHGNYTLWSSWYGKMGLIDVVAGGDGRKTLAGFCRFDNKKMNVADFDYYEKLLSSAMLKPNEIFIFSKVGFTEEMDEFAAKRHINLVRLEDL